MSRFLLTISLVLFAAGPQPAVVAADWPHYRGPNRNGIVNEKLDLLPDGAKKQWETEVGNGNGGIAIAGGRAYTGARKPDDGIVCLDANTGNQIWFRALDSWSFDCTPSVENGKVYALASKEAPRACCLDAETGRVLWERALPKSTGERHYGHAGSPLLWQDLVILNAGAGVALKKDSGDVVWSHPGLAGLATPVLFAWKSKPCLAIFSGDRLVARDARSGRELFQIPWKTQLAVNACDPIIFGEKILLCSDYGFGRALFDFSSGKPEPVWEVFKRGGHAYSSGMLHEGAIYLFTADNFVCLDPVTGEPRWEEGGTGSAIIVGDTCIRVMPSGGFVIGHISPQGFEQLQAGGFNMAEIKNAPAYSNGRLIARNEKGHVVCLQIGNPAAPGARPSPPRPARGLR
jgi:outer membrane protein assembly factor BamB